jgi:hypothetical protein
MRCLKTVDRYTIRRRHERHRPSAGLGIPTVAPPCPATALVLPLAPPPPSSPGESCTCGMRGRSPSQPAKSRGLRHYARTRRFRLGERLHSRWPPGWFRSTGLPSGPPSSSMAGCRTISRATAGTSTGVRSWRSSRRPAGARWSAATCCAKRAMQSSERSPRRRAAPPTPAAHFPASRPAVTPFGCRPSRIASKMSGARQVSGRSRQT